VRGRRRAYNKIGRVLKASKVFPPRLPCARGPQRRPGCSPVSSGTREPADFRHAGRAMEIAGSGGNATRQVLIVGTPGQGHKPLRRAILPRRRRCARPSPRLCVFPRTRGNGEPISGGSPLSDAASRVLDSAYRYFGFPTWREMRALFKLPRDIHP
jgi:hypothetical protein